jgi:hypothetical protein
MKPISNRIKIALVLVVIAAIVYLFISILAPPLFSQAPIKHVLKSSPSNVVQTVQVEVVPLFDAVMKMYDKLLISLGGTVSFVVLLRDKLKQPPKEPKEKTKRKNRFY